ncbi:MAG TPA: hypothetical protein VK507_24730 [Iamia sp.]|nr:hypothetical protein [Iamia sp.]
MLTERNRAVLYRRLSEMVGDEEAVGEMLSNFPSGDRDPFVTKSMLELTESRLRTEMHKLGLRLIMWMVGLQIAAVTLMSTVLRR